jgi:hypothetical protein
MSLGEMASIQPKQFAQESLGSISLYRIPRLPADRNPQSRNSAPVLLQNDGKVL